MTKAIYGKTDSKIPVSRKVWKGLTPYIVQKDLTIGEFFDEDKWPSRGGKFKPGDKVRVCITCRSGQKRFKVWKGKRGVIVGWRRTSTTSAQNQSEYKVFDTGSKRSRWIWADQLVKIGQ
jgi:hypothetical protein